MPRETDYRKEPLFGDEFDVTIDAIFENKETFSDGSDRQSQDMFDESSSDSLFGSRSIKIVTSIQSI
jgi:hypothetical protein